MKIKLSNTAFILCVLTLVISCRKKESGNDSYYGKYNNTGLTSITVRKIVGVHDTARVVNAITYDGNNPVLTTPVITNDFFGSIKLTYSGSKLVKVSKLIYLPTPNQSEIQEYRAYTLTYNSAGKIDAIILENQFANGNGYIEYAKFMFRYFGDKLVKVYGSYDKQGQQYLFDTVHSGTTFNYTGENVTSVSDGYNVIYYFPGSAVNNLSRSLPCWLIAYTLENNPYNISGFISGIPLYMNPNVTDSTDYPAGSGTRDQTIFTHNFDAAGRIAQEIRKVRSTGIVDTFWFNY